MAGTLIVDSLKASTGVLATQNGMTGVPKAWALFNGTAATVIGSFNVSSITRNSTGNYTCNYTTAMPSGAYSSVITACDNPGTANDYLGIRYPTNTSASALGILIFRASTNTSTDLTAISFAIFSS